MMSSGTRRCELVWWWGGGGWLIDPFPVRGSPGFTSSWGHPSLTSWPWTPDPTWPVVGSPPPRSIAHKQHSSAYGKRDRTFGQAEVFSTEGLVQGVWQWPWQDIVGPLLMAGHLSRGTTGERVKSHICSFCQDSRDGPWEKSFTTLKLT